MGTEEETSRLLEALEKSLAEVRGVSAGADEEAKEVAANDVIA